MFTDAEKKSLAGVWPPTPELLTKAGHERVSPLEAIRAFCVECSGGSPQEARLCQAISCQLWPFRSGGHPWHGAKGRRATNVNLRGLRGQQPHP